MVCTRELIFLVYYFSNYPTFQLQLDLQFIWPAGAMVARGPPKAKAVCSSRTSVVIHSFCSCIEVALSSTSFLRQLRRSGSLLAPIFCCLVGVFGESIVFWCWWGVGDGSNDEHGLSVIKSRITASIVAIRIRFVDSTTTCPDEPVVSPGRAYAGASSATSPVVANL